MHRMDERRREKDRRHRNHPMVWLYDEFHLEAIAGLPGVYRKWLQLDPFHVVESTMGVKEACSISLVRCSYVLCFSFSCLQ